MAAERLAEWSGIRNHAGQLREVVRPDGQRVTFGYDALGRRVRKTSGGRTTTYVWDGNDLVHEVTEGDALVTWEFEPGTFAPIAKVEGDKRYGVVTDHLGTPVALFDERGEVAWKADLDLYGAAREEVAQTGCPWRWPGQYEDEETGLYYNRFRYYDPNAGRYISQDPMRLMAGLQPFAYVSNPLSAIDPLGLSTCGPGDPVDLFRAVGPEEFDDIMRSGAFRVGGNSLAAKQFGFNKEEVIRLTDHFADMVAVVRVRLPQATVDLLDHTPVDRMILRSGSVTAHAGDQLDLLNRTVIEIEHVF